MSTAELTITQASSAIASGALSAEDLTTECLARIRARDPELNAVIALDADAALERARICDRQRAGGLLNGLPLGYKDMFHRLGEISTYGGPEHHWHLAQDTSPIIGALEAAGGIFCARLNMAEFAMGPTGHNPTFGRCRNPHDPVRITGGSSSGSAAAIAAGYVLGALGSDTGGSVRLPAAMCGVAGLKPTQHRLPVAGMMALSASLDCPGVMAHTSRDVAVLWEAITGTAPAIDADGPPLTIGIPRGYYLDGLDPDVSSAFQATLSCFERAGAQVIEIAIPDQTNLPHLADILWKSEAAALHRLKLAPGPAQLGAQARARLAQGLGVQATDYVDAMKMRVVALRRMLSGPLSAADVFISPTVPVMTPLAEEASANAGDKMRLTLERLSHATRPISALGLPALSVPMGRDRNAMPMGLQIVGRPNSENVLLRAGAMLEDALGH